MYKVAFYTLGCKVNQYDTQVLQRAFAAQGFEIVDFHEKADAYVINTCTVTRVADRKSRKMAGVARRRNDRAVVAICGCYPAGALPEAERLPGVHVVRGNRDKDELVDQVVTEVRQRAEPGLGDEPPTPDPDLYPLSPSTFPARTRALLKVQDGCNHVCAFCIVPRVRGPQRSRTPDEVLAEAHQLVEAGFAEIVLTGVRLGAFGHDWEGRTGSRDRPLIDLLHQLHQLEGLQRLRLSSLLPLDVTPNLLRTMAELPRVCPHLHLPLQSGDDRVLKRMRRAYRTRHFAELVAQARELMPHLAVTTDLMVGFPGETDAEFENTLRFCAEMRFAGMHIFPYSRRPQTEAEALRDQVPHQVKEHRRAMLQALHDRLAADFHRAQIGRIVWILAETAEDGVVSGWTDNYIRGSLKGTAAPGTFVPLRITEAHTEGVVGELVKSPPGP